MQSILEQLYDVPINYNNMSFEQNSDYAKRTKVRNDIIDMLTEQFTNEQKALFEAYYEANGYIAEMMNYRKFTYGFHLGSLLMLEIMLGQKDM